MKEILMIIGIITVGGIIFLAFYMACESIKEKNKRMEMGI